MNPKQGLTLQQLSSTLKAQLDSKKDYLVSVPALSIPYYRPTSTWQALEFEGEAFELTPYAHGQLAEFIGVRKDYYDRMRKDAPELWATTVRRWLEEKGDENRLVRVLDGKIRAFLSDSYMRVDNWDVVNAALPAMMEAGLVIQTSQVTESKVYLQASSPTITAPDPGKGRVGAIVEAGVQVSNSEIGAGAIQVVPYYKFLWCVNGMTRTELAWRKAHLGAKLDASMEGFLSDETKRLEDQAVLSKIKDMVKAALDYNRFRKDIESMKELTEVSVRPEKTVELLSDRFQLRETEKDSILEHLLKGGDLSAYGMVNAVTRTAQDLDNFDRGTELESIGGKLIDLDPAQWASVVE